MPSSKQSDKMIGMSHPNHCFPNGSVDFISYFKVDYCRPETRPWRNFKLVIVFISNLGNIQFIFFSLSYNQFLFVPQSSLRFRYTLRLSLHHWWNVWLLPAPLGAWGMSKQTLDPVYHFNEKKES